MESHRKSGMSQKQAFGLGVVGGVLILCTIGFFILLSVVLKDDGGKAAVLPTPSGGAAAPTQPAQPTKITVADVDKKKDHIRGNAKAKVTLIEFSDMDCPFCQRFHDSMNKIIENYGDDVRWVYRHFPLDSLHPNARPKAIASECAAEQGKFWEFTDANFDSGLADVEAIAKQAGVGDIDKFNKCVSDKKYAKDVQDDEQDGAGAGAQGTPYSIIVGPDGETIPINGAQPYENVEAAIKSLL